MLLYTKDNRRRMRVTSMWEDYWGCLIHSNIIFWLIGSFKAMLLMERFELTLDKRLFSLMAITNTL